MPQMNIIPLNTEVELAEDWTFDFVVAWWSGDQSILDLVGAIVPLDADGNYVSGSVVPVVIPQGVRILIRKYDLNQGNINGKVTVTIRLLGRSPKVKLPISEINKLSYNRI